MVLIAPTLDFRPTGIRSSREANIRTQVPPAQFKARGWGNAMCDTQANVPSTEASGATCVQRLDGSRDSAIHTKYRISLRSSSMREPRYPLPRVVMNNRRLHGIPHTHHVWGDGSIALLLKFLGAFRAGVRCAAEKKPERP